MNQTSTSSSRSLKPLIIGGGYAGLAAALELSRRSIPFVLIESAAELGGQSRTTEKDGFKFDLGPHIFFRQDEGVNQIWDSLMPTGFESHVRKSLLYFRGKLIHSPLKPWNALFAIGPLRCLRALLSFAVAQLDRRKKKRDDDCESWVRNRFGNVLYEMFFHVYNEKIWGVPCSRISASWPARRIKATLLELLIKAFKRDDRFSLKRFSYPRGGSEQMIEAFSREIARLNIGSVLVAKKAMKISVEDHHVQVEFDDQTIHQFTHVISTMNLPELISIIEPAPSIAVLNAAAKLRYRALINVNLMVRKDDWFGGDAHWIDVHDRSLKLLRCTNYSAFGSEMAPDDFISLSVEYVCEPDDEVWASSETALVAQAIDELKQMSLLRPTAQPRGFCSRCRDAYPKCEIGFENEIQMIAQYLGELPELQSVGRNGLFTYNNMHHSIRTGIAAVENIMGGTNNIWSFDTVASVGGRR